MNRSSVGDGDSKKVDGVVLVENGKSGHWDATGGDLSDKATKLRDHHSRELYKIPKVSMPVNGDSLSSISHYCRTSVRQIHWFARLVLTELLGCRGSSCCSPCF
jgi:hypothetical protein